MLNKLVKLHVFVFAITTICSLLCIITIPVGMKVLFELVMHKPIENFDTSLENIIDWYQSNEKWWKINYEDTLAKRSKRFLIE